MTLVTGLRTCARLAARLRRDTDAVTAVEFGIVAFPFFAMLVATFEVAYIHLQSELLSGAVTKAARIMLTGSVQSNKSVTDSTSFVNTYLCPASGPRLIPITFDCSKLVVDVRPVSSFASGDLTNDIYKGSTMFCPGQAGQIVLMRVTYPLPAILPLSLYDKTIGTVNDVPGSSGRYHILLARALFQEESFSGAYTSPAGC